MNIFCTFKHVTKLFLATVMLFSLQLNFGHFFATNAHAAMSNEPPVDGSVINLCLPSIAFTSKPPYGSLVEKTQYGRVDCVNPADYKVAVYIYVTGWWTKPTWDHPLWDCSPRPCE